MRKFLPLVFGLLLLCSPGRATASTSGIFLAQTPSLQDTISQFLSLLYNFQNGTAFLGNSSSPSSDLLDSYEDVASVIFDLEPIAIAAVVAVLVPFGSSMALNFLRKITSKV